VFFVYFPKGNCSFTFAWFQATSAVQIAASSSSATITVSKPNDLAVKTELWLYKGRSDDSAGKTVNSTNFDSVNLVSPVRISDFWPGETLTYAAHFQATSSSITTGTMDLSYSATNKTNRLIQTNKSNCVTILTAIKLTTSYGTTNTSPAANAYSSDKIETDNAGVSKLVATSTGTLSNAISNTFNSTDAWFFYKITFETGSGKTYKETDEDGNVIYDTPESDDDERFFVIDDTASGNSSCYEGTTFDVTRLAFTVNNI